MKKYKIWIVLQILCILILLPACFMQEKLVYLQFGEDMNCGETGIPFVGEKIELSPGVYQVRVKADISQDALLYIDLNCEQGSFRTVRCNGATMFAGQEYLDFEVYVLEKNHTAYVQCDFFGTNYNAVHEIGVYCVNFGWRILLCTILCLFALVDFLVIFRQRILQGKVGKDRQMAFWILAASVILACLPYMTDYFSLGWDGSFHLTRIEGLKETILQGGQFPVKMQSYWIYDHGYPVSTFYGDLFMALPVFMRLMGFPIMTCYKVFVFVVTAATAWIAYYSFEKCTGNVNASLVGAVAYVLAPYRLHNIYFRAAVGEYVAMAFIPLILWGIYGLYTKDPKEPSYKKYKIPLIIGLSCVLQAHLLSCEMVIFFIAVVCVVCLKKTFRKETFSQLVQMSVLCLLLNCWFWLPLIWMMTRETYALAGMLDNNVQESGIRFADLFQLFTGGEEDILNEPFYIGVAATLGLFCVLAGIVCLKRNRDDGKKTNNLYYKTVLMLTGLIVLALVMSTRYFPWLFLGDLPGAKMIVNALQLPFRLLSVASALGAFLVVFLIIWLRQWLQERKLWEAGGEKILTAVQVFLVILTVGAATYQTHTLTDETEPVWLYNVENMGTTGVVNGEYLPYGLSRDDYYYHGPVSGKGIRWSNYLKNGVNIDIEVENTLDKESYIDLPLIGYQGYAVSSHETEKTKPYISEERGEHGDLRIAIPAGYEGELQIRYKGFALYRIAEWISVITGFGTVCYAVLQRRKYADRLHK
ncbi:MAG: hypothetical protein IJ282_05100 [Lachnospiraceae bacterium]|nr:hypothetical protein [Lachnospiraceae bacterium]